MQGKTINSFTLQRLLGKGGMAEVWYAENKIGKKAAVKILLSKYCDDDNVTSRFSTEAKVMVELQTKSRVTTLRELREISKPSFLMRATLDIIV